MTCERCQQTHTRCKAHNSRGEPCGVAPMNGQAVCRTHGGSSPNGRAAGERRLAEAEAVKTAARFGLPRDIDPGAAILEEVHRTAGMVDWYWRQIVALDPDVNPDKLFRGVTKVQTAEGFEQGRKVTVAAAPHVLVTLWREERQHLVAVCSAALRAGIEERRVRLAEAQGDLLAQVIKGVLGDLNLTPEQQAKVGVVVPRHLRLVADPVS